MRFTVLCFLGCFLPFSPALAQDWPAELQPGAAYPQARAWLLQQGWQPVVNQHINDSSLFANEIAAQGMPEVVDCISMALDGCSFRWQKNRRRLDISTITRQLHIDQVTARPH